MAIFGASPGSVPTPHVRGRGGVVQREYKPCVFIAGTLRKTRNCRNDQRVPRPKWAALLDDPANARDPPRSPGIFVAEYLPALVNALRVFLGEHPEHPLTHQARHLVYHQLGRTVIGEAASINRICPSVEQTTSPWPPRSSSHRQTPLPPSALQRVQSQTDPRYTPSAGRAPPGPEINRLCNSLSQNPGPPCTYPL